MKAKRIRLKVCSGTSCVGNGSFHTRKTLEEQLQDLGASGSTRVETIGCLGLCAEGPVIVVEPDNVLYHRLTPADIRRVVKEHVLGGKPVRSLVFTPPEKETPVPRLSEIDFFKHQMLIALRNRGRIDPEKIDDYIGQDGYEGLAKALLAMTPEEVIKEVKESGIRGRGGAGFPTGLKWEFCRNAPGNGKYLICNADEGDPGAFMDRSILEADPHAVLEGMTIAGKAIGASQGIIYVRDEYPLALRRLRIAIEQSEKYGLLGNDILGSGHNFRVRLVRGGGAFVCGEETALIVSVEGHAGRPRPRPPYPAQQGLWGKPTVINNVETLANIPLIIRHGGSWFAGIGTEHSKGTKVFSLVGAVNNTGLVEVPMGTTLRTIVTEIGGGIPNGRKFKAVQSGGPSGGCIPERLLDLPVDYEELSKTGAIMGSGGLIVMDETSCMVDVAKYFLGLLMEESCGKCTPCREGISRMHEILTDITEGKGTMEQLELLGELAPVVKDASLCGLGQTAPNPVLTTIRHFRDEYVAHIENKICPAGVCRSLITYSIDAELCTGCQACKKVCPVAAITGVKKQTHRIDPALCIKCGACEETCSFKAVVRRRGASIPARAHPPQRRDIPGRAS